MLNDEFPAANHVNHCFKGSHEGQRQYSYSRTLFPRLTDFRTIFDKNLYHTFKQNNLSLHPEKTTKYNDYD